VRSLLSTFFSEHFILTSAAYVSLFLVVVAALWVKFAHVVELIAATLRKWILGFLDFVDEVRARLDRRANPSVESSSRGPSGQPHPRSESTARIDQDELHVA
jgi:hypothetical protein